MGLSNFTTMPDKKISGFAGKQSSVPMYLQFVSGYCSEVLHSKENAYHEGLNHTNSIIAVPHHSDKIFKTKATSVSDEDRYYPLFRTMHDVPTKGDTVLLTNISGVNYYLGPLNMDSNNPTWNQSRFKVTELVIPTDKAGETTERAQNGESKNFNKEVLFNRLAKFRNKDLDYGPTLNETTGDTLIEGRHGNSLRIGSRSNDPYIFISNERAYTNTVETLGDGSIISITSNGTLAQHFGDYEDIGSKTILNEFKMSSDLFTDNNYPIGNIYKDLNGLSDDTTIYEYNGNQMLFHSDRITLNSKIDDIFLSSFKDIHIGSGEKISISSGTSVNIKSENVNIGSSVQENMQSMVLGDNLTDVLNKIVGLFSKIKIMTQTGPQGIQSDPTYQAVVGKDIDLIINDIKNITSTKHKIEENTSN